MTYYEELGVKPDAPAEEIRSAHARLAGRLDLIRETLLDPAGRESYDRSLGALAAAVAGEARAGVPERTRARALPPGWIAVAAWLVVLVLAAWPGRAPAVGEDSERGPRVADEAEWEPLATYAYESHMAIPPLPFPEAREGVTRTRSSGESEWEPGRAERRPARREGSRRIHAPPPRDRNASRRSGTVP